MNLCLPQCAAGSYTSQCAWLPLSVRRLLPVFLGSFILANAVPAVAQQSPAGPRLLNAEQGRGIAAAALDQDSSSRAQDCSHLVHQIYLAAGYEYPYASSLELYAGSSNFRRVRHPQPGDLIAWRGHVGIIVDPKRHSFYSLVRSGLQTEDYQAPYWRSRGTPRFYRYIVGPDSRMETTKLATSTAPSSGKSFSSTSGTVRAEPRTKNDDQDTKPAAEETSLRSKLMVPSEPATPASARSAYLDSAEILVTAEQRRPTAGEVLYGVSEINSSAANILQGAQLLSTEIPVIIFDQLSVERVETKREKGWAQIQIDSHVRIAADGPDFKQRREKVRWELRRDASGWTIVAPHDRAYVSRDAAVRVLSAQLAELAQSEAAAQRDQTVLGQEARIVNLLSALLEK
jgi:hypothetical protein